MELFKHVLSLYSWAVIGVLIGFLWQIARFFEKTSGQNVGYDFLLLPALLLAAGAVWYLTHSVEFNGEPAGDLFLFLGGALVWAFGVRLQESMTGE